MGANSILNQELDLDLSRTVSKFRQEQKRYYMSGRKRQFSPVFPKEFLEYARVEGRSKIAPYQLVQRCRLLVLLAENPNIKDDEAGAKVGLSGRQVLRWRKRWAEGDFSLDDLSGRGRKNTFTALDRAIVKAVACEVVAESKQPLSRQSLGDLTRRTEEALGKPISRSTVWRILKTDAIKPWRYRYWLFPRDPNFAEKAGPILDLYAGHWLGQPLGPKDYVLSADEKTSIQARIRTSPTLGPKAAQPTLVEHGYKRGGALQYLAAWDVQRGYVFGRCEPKTGIEPFKRLVKQVICQEPYASSTRLFWIVDNGSSHRGEASRLRMSKLDERIILLHTPVHASWLNQIEIYFSIIQRKVLTPNDFKNLQELELRLALYEKLTNQRPTPFKWKFDRKKMADWLAKVHHK